ncbi:MAG: cation transporter, partial [Clostridia bacterium]|nr:cation transporter [Clostridia bacterium]
MYKKLGEGRSFMESEVTIQREKKGKIASIVGVIANIILAAGKIVVGTLFGFISVLADGLNNLSDSGSSLISFVSFKLSSKPADKEHPYGHERIEYVASMVVSFLILLIAFELLTESVSKIISPEELELSYVIIVVLAASIVIKLGMFFYYSKIAKEINSTVLKATAFDSVSDCVSTTAVFIAIII